MARVWTRDEAEKDPKGPHSECWEVHFWFQVSENHREKRMEQYFTVQKGSGEDVRKRWMKEHQHEYKKIECISIIYQ